MLEQTKRISFITSSVLSKVEPAPTKKYRLRNTKGSLLKKMFLLDLEFDPSLVSSPVPNVFFFI